MTKQDVKSIILVTKLQYVHDCLDVVKGVCGAQIESLTVWNCMCDFLPECLLHLGIFLFGLFIHHNHIVRNFLGRICLFQCSACRFLLFLLELSITNNITGSHVRDTFHFSVIEAFHNRALNKLDAFVNRKE
eukprot:TRINITY_DN3814_c0_g3_i3.p1 TRINITY_DN3814_c0_g3~~TRINITY_DN3814_c0_g3_i3.p1  ORF type:complete len:132 (-),score=3.68 TRINITY_DN3814_c0_g3_i3:124-519(-)